MFCNFVYCHRCLVVCRVNNWLEHVNKLLIKFLKCFLFVCLFSNCFNSKLIKINQKLMCLNILMNYSWHKLYLNLFCNFLTQNFNILHHNLIVYASNYSKHGAALKCNPKWEPYHEKQLYNLKTDVFTNHSPIKNINENFKQTTTRSYA